MFERRAKLDVASLGELPEQLEGVISAEVGRVRKLEPDDIASAAKTRLLIVGAYPDTTELSAMLVSLRESMPSLLVFSIAESHDAVRGVGFVDAVFEWPSDRERIIREIRAALAGTFPSTTRWLSENRLLPLTVAATTLGLLLIWQLFDSLQILPVYILPGPAAVARAFLSDPQLYLWHSLVTAGEAAAGFAIANTAAAATAVLLHRSRILRDISLPMLTGLQALPIIVLAPLLAVWLGTGVTSKIAMAGIVAFFPLVSNLLAAFVAIDRQLVDLFAFHRASYGQTLRHLLLPASYPAIVAALRISGGLAVVGAIVAEFTGADRGLGFLLLNTTYRLETAPLFVAVLMSAALGVIFASAPNILRVTSAGRLHGRNLGRQQSR